MNMGYYTNFEIRTIDLAKPGFKPEEMKDVINKLEELSTYSFEYYSKDDHAAATSGGIKWYDHEKDITEVSKSFPRVMIIVDGRGEDPKDIWRTFYVNGKSKFTEPVFVEPSQELMLELLTKDWPTSL